MFDLSTLRIGQGFDVHAFDESRKLILGGVEIPHTHGLLGHSDADVLTHALMDAIIGALALGDIGHFFPDNDPQYKNISSLLLLQKVIEIVYQKYHYNVLNCDLTLIAQRPKLAAYRDEMRRNIASSMNLDITQVSVKFTTTEKLGFAGREEGIAAQAVVLLFKKERDLKC